MGIFYFISFLIPYLIQGNHHEVPLAHERMRNLQVRLINRQVVIEQDVNVDRSVFIEMGKMFLPSQFALDLLSDLEELARCEGCLAENHAIEKPILRLEAPRLRLDEGGLPKHRPYPLTYQRYGFADMRCLIAKVRTEPQEYFMYISLTSHLLLLTSYL